MAAMKVSFPGGVAVAAEFKNHIVVTDQPAPLGADAAMSPFDLFLASIATCMGFYALRFCQERGLSTDGLGLSLTPRRNAETKKLETVTVELRTPAAFPEKYNAAIHRAIDQCAVKKVLADPPQFEVSVTAPALA